MLRYKGAIIDLDGTLLNTVADLGDSVNAALGVLGFPPHDYEAYKKKIGHGFRNLIEVSLPEGKADDTLIEKGLAIFLGAYDERYRNKSRPYEGMVALVAALNKSGLIIGVNSNKRNDYTRTLISDFFPEGSFVAVFGERSGVPKKPDPMTALEIAGIMGLKPEEIVYIGDTATDIQTGKNAGMDTIGVSWGFRGRAELESCGASFVVDKPEEIPGIITAVSATQA
ncbi:MAG: HAD family hydrolase [Clostridia bacterium]|nr:HAD family hydrolase [Clostridia bacterium]